MATGPTGPLIIENINGGYATGPIPPGASGSDFSIQYTNIAKNGIDLDKVKLTFSDFNEPRKIRFFQEAFNVVWKQETEEKIGLDYFFYPLQSFSGYQKQTFVIKAESYFYFDPGYFGDTQGEIGFLFARAYYLPDASPDERIIYWSYGASGENDPNKDTYVMGDFLSLTGAIKESSTWHGWNSNGFYFTNPTRYNVKLKIITAN